MEVKQTEKLYNFDLDVMNVLKDFPENDEDSFLFIRGKMDLKNNKILPSFALIKGTVETLAASLYSLIKSDRAAQEAAYTAVFTCLLERTKEDRESFISILKEK